MKRITKAAMALGAVITVALSIPRTMKRIRSMECSQATEDRLREEWENQQAKVASEDQE